MPCTTLLSQSASTLTRRNETNASLGIVIIALLVVAVGLAILGYYKKCTGARARRAGQTDARNMNVPPADEGIEMHDFAQSANGETVASPDLPALPRPAHLNAGNATQNHTRAPRRSGNGGARSSQSIQE